MDDSRHRKHSDPIPIPLRVNPCRLHRLLELDPDREFSSWDTQQQSFSTRRSLPDAPWTNAPEESHLTLEQYITTTTRISDQQRWSLPTDTPSGISRAMRRVRATSSPVPKPPQFLCPVYPCERTFDMEEDLKIHTIEAHKLEKPLPYVCGLCDMGFMNSYQFQAHLHSHAKPSIALGRTPGDLDDLRNRLSSMSMKNGGVEVAYGGIRDDIDIMSDHKSSEPASIQGKCLYYLGCPFLAILPFRPKRFNNEHDQ